MKLSIKDSKGNAAGELDVRFELIADGRGTQAVHDTVVAYNAAQRSGTACTKTMGDVAGTGKKPWRQKGTGRARAGSFASPLWRGGGVVFVPKPRDFSKKVNKKVKNLALRKALSERLKSGDVVLISDLKLAAAKTKDFVSVLQALGLDGNTNLVVLVRPTSPPTSPAAMWPAWNSRPPIWSTPTTCSSTTSSSSPRPASRRSRRASPSNQKGKPT